MGPIQTEVGGEESAMVCPPDVHRPFVTPTLLSPRVVVRCIAVIRRIWINDELLAEDMKPGGHRDSVTLAERKVVRQQLQMEVLAVGGR